MHRAQAPTHLLGAICWSSVQPTRAIGAPIGGLGPAPHPSPLTRGAAATPPRRASQRPAQPRCAGHAPRSSTTTARGGSRRWRAVGGGAPSRLVQRFAAGDATNDSEQLAAELVRPLADIRIIDAATDHAEHSARSRNPVISSMMPTSGRSAACWSMWSTAWSASSSAPKRSSTRSLGIRDPPSVCPVAGSPKNAGAIGWSDGTRPSIRPGELGVNPPTTR